jgi:hypothetical protein
VVKNTGAYEKGASMRINAHRWASMGIKAKFDHAFYMRLFAKAH